MIGDFLQHVHSIHQTPRLQPFGWNRLKSGSWRFLKCLVFLSFVLSLDLYFLDGFSLFLFVSL